MKKSLSKNISNQLSSTNTSKISKQNTTSKSTNDKAHSLPTKYKNINKAKNNPNINKTLTDKINDKSKLKHSYLTKDIIAKFPTNKQYVVNQWIKIEKMRNLILAPVDQMGVTKCGDKEIDIENYKFQQLVSLRLSAMTKDETTFAATRNIHKYGFTIDKIKDIDLDLLISLVKNCNYNKTKAIDIIKIANIVANDLNYKMPTTINDVMKLPGIGPKMGHLYMQCCYGINTGIAVDTHVHRIANKLEWVNDNYEDVSNIYDINNNNNNNNKDNINIENNKIKLSTKHSKSHTKNKEYKNIDPKKTMKKLEEFLPNELWDSVNYLLVGFGQTICKAISPDCSNCLLNTECKYGITEMHSKNVLKKRGLSKISKNLYNNSNKDKTTPVEDKYSLLKKKKVINSNVNTSDEDKLLSLEAYKYDKNNERRSNRKKLELKYEI